MTGFRTTPRTRSVDGPAQHAVRPGVPDENDLVTIGHVLRGLAFPARAWQIVTTAETYGADAHTREQFRRLPDVHYHSIGHVGAMCAGLPVPPRPGPARPRP